MDAHERGQVVRKTDDACMQIRRGVENFKKQEEGRTSFIEEECISCLKKRYFNCIALHCTITDQCQDLWYV